MSYVVLCRGIQSMVLARLRISANLCCSTSCVDVVFSQRCLGVIRVSCDLPAHP